MTLQNLFDSLEAAALSDDDKKDARALAADLADLLSAQMAGKNVDAEIVQVKAQAANLSAAATTQVFAEFTRWSANLLANLVTKIL